MLSDSLQTVLLCFAREHKHHPVPLIAAAVHSVLSSQVAPQLISIAVAGSVRLNGAPIGAKLFVRVPTNVQVKLNEQKQKTRRST